MVIRVEVSAHALGRARFVYSPLWELTSSLRLVLHEPDIARHGPWLRWVRRRLDDELLGVLRHVVPQPHHFPDFLTPAPGSRPRSLRTELVQLGALDPDTARAELAATGDWPPPASLHRLMRGPEPMPRLAEALGAYWQAAVAPVWPRIRRLLAADLAFRADELAADGLARGLNHLHPTVSFDGESLVVDTPRHEVVRRRAVDSVSFVPCVFAWPYALAVVCEPHPVSVSYAPRGAAALWLSPLPSNDRTDLASDRRVDQPVGDAVVDLIGRSRSSILTLLDLPVSATQIAEQTGLSLPAVSQQLSVLRAAGLITSRRSGRSVWSVRTGLGTELLRAAAD